MGKEIDYRDKVPTEKSFNQMGIEPEGLYFYSDKPFHHSDGNQPHTIGKNLLRILNEKFTTDQKVFISGPSRFVGEEQ